MAVKIVSARASRHPAVDLVLWRALKGNRTAVAVVRELPFGSELRISVDDDLRWSSITHGDVQAVAREHLRAFEARGWQHEQAAAVSE